MDYNNLVIRDGARSYKILRRIGTWGPESSLIVYEAVINNRKATHVALKMIKCTDELQDYHEMVTDDLNRSDQFVPDHNHDLFPILKHFHSQVDGDPILCIVLPYDSQAVSLRSLLSSNPRFACGIHEKCIKIVLVTVLEALNKIHDRGDYHMQITAGNIFYNHRMHTIQLAYAATTYERDTPSNDGNVCSVTKMLAWGLAPEVQNADEPLEFVNTYDTAKSDIWLVGIAALELAYGQIPVESRRELLQIASYVSEVKTLPNTWEELRHVSAEFAVDKALPLRKRRFKEPSTAALATEGEIRFTDRFSSWVAMCLDADVKTRASVMQLMNHIFLRENAGGVGYFRDAIVIGLNPHVIRFLTPKTKKERSEMLARNHSRLQQRRTLCPSRFFTSELGTEIENNV